MSKHMKDLLDWAESDDSVLIADEGNGYSRSDGYDATILRSRSTGRYIVLVGRPGWAEDCYVATTLEAAQAAIEDGYTPGTAPGQFTWIADASRLKEVRRHKAP